MLSAILIMAGGCASVPVLVPPNLTSVLTHHNDAGRTGTYDRETRLTPINVNSASFGRIATLVVEGDVYAQPLYVERATIKDKGVHSALIVATARNMVYAFDANATGRVTQPLWVRSFGGAVPMPNPDFGNLSNTCKLYLDGHRGVLPPESERVRTRDHTWYNMREIGITGTPVLDEKAGVVYLASLERHPGTHRGVCTDFGVCDAMKAQLKKCPQCPLRRDCAVHDYHYRLHALSLASGDDLPGSPVEISGSAQATSAGSVSGQYRFEPTLQLQRAALLLAPRPRGTRGAGNPVLYIAFGGHGDVGFYHGWVFAYDARTLERLAVFLTALDRDQNYNNTSGTSGDGIVTPFNGGEQGGIWQAGSGPAADAEGNVYVMVGNGSNTFAHGGRNFGDSFVKLRLQGNSFSVRAWTPWLNNQIDTKDYDLGSSGPLVSPNLGLIVGGDKVGRIYVLDTDLNSKFAFQATWRRNGSNDCSDRDTVSNVHIHGSPVFWNGPDGPTLYVWGEQDYLKAYRFNRGTIPTDQNCSVRANPHVPPPVPYGVPVGVGVFHAVLDESIGDAAMPGGILSLSSDADTPGTGIVWASRVLSGTALFKVPDGVLEAYDATPVKLNPVHQPLPVGISSLKRLWSSEDNPLRDKLGLFARFTPPTIAGGRVFVATFSNEIAVYGQLSENGCGGADVNGCGGCNVLLARPGQWCQDRATSACGRWQCLGTQALTCETSGVSQGNECEGCAQLPVPGSGFGRGDFCWFNNSRPGRLVCSSGRNSLVCEAAP